MTDLVPSRTSLHAVAEHVLAPFRHGHTGRIGLVVAAGGFGTPWVPTPDGEVQAVVAGTELVVSTREGEASRHLLTTLTAAAAVLGIEPGAPADVYTPTTSLDPDAPLTLDPVAVAELDAWFALGGQALAGLATEHRVDNATLWPEHFDVAVTLDEVNLGFSPGDGSSDEPYAYVGPWEPPAQDEFWNAPFGASRPRAEIPDVAAALAFLREGHRRALALRSS